VLQLTGFMQTRHNGTSVNLHKFNISNAKLPNCKKKYVAPYKTMMKRCEIQGGGQEMAVMVG